MDIKPNLVLALNPDNPYGEPSGKPVLVTGIKQRKGYAVPWILSGRHAFKPPDFSTILRLASDTDKPDSEGCACNVCVCGFAEA